MDSFNLNLFQFLYSISHYVQPYKRCVSLFRQMSDHPTPFSFTRPRHSPRLFISPSILLRVLLSCTVIITSRSSSSFDSVSLTDPQLAALHAAANGYLINLSLQVQLGESDKLGNVASCIIKGVQKGRAGEGAVDGRYWQRWGSDRLKVIRFKK